MRVAVLSRSRGLYTTRRLLEACRSEGMTPQVLDPLNLSVRVGGGPPRLFLGESGKAVSRMDLAFARIGPALSDYALMVLRQLEGMGVPVVNGSLAVGRTRDKMACLQLLCASGIPTPRTAIIRHPRQLPLALDQVGGPPVVLKLLHGSQGIGVVLLETLDAIESVLDTLWSLGQTILIQEFIAESRGQDLRVLVVGDEVLVAMRRRARAGEFRSNIHRGGTGTLVEPDAAVLGTAVKAARAVGIDVAGVDLLETSDGPKVIEVNSSPGFQGLEAASGIDVAGAIVRYGSSMALRRAASGSAARPAVAASPQGPR